MADAVQKPGPPEHAGGPDKFRRKNSEIYEAFLWNGEPLVHTPAVPFPEWVLQAGADKRLSIESHGTPEVKCRIRDTGEFCLPGDYLMHDGAKIFHVTEAELHEQFVPLGKPEPVR
jgi:hypothetical protein